MDDLANLTLAYRQARRDFIAACQSAGADAIARVHPEKGPDGKPLFCDSAVFGPRGPKTALLLIGGAEIMTLLKGPIGLAPGCGLVAIHALDPFARTWGRPGPTDWPRKTLAAIAAEDLSRVEKLSVLDWGDAEDAEGLLATALPGAVITCQAGPAFLAAMDALEGSGL